MAHWRGHATGLLFQAPVLSSLQHALSSGRARPWASWAQGQQALLLEVLPISFICSPPVTRCCHIPGEGGDCSVSAWDMMELCWLETWHCARHVGLWL